MSYVTWHSYNLKKNYKLKTDIDMECVCSVRADRVWKSGRVWKNVQCTRTTTLYENTSSKDSTGFCSATTAGQLPFVCCSWFYFGKLSVFHPCRHRAVIQSFDEFDCILVCGWVGGDWTDLTSSCYHFRLWCLFLAFSASTVLAHSRHFFVEACLRNLEF